MKFLRCFQSGSKFKAVGVSILCFLLLHWRLVNCATALLFFSMRCPAGSRTLGLGSSIFTDCGCIDGRIDVSTSEGRKFCVPPQLSLLLEVGWFFKEILGADLTCSRGSFLLPWWFVGSQVVVNPRRLFEL